MFHVANFTFLLLLQLSFVKESVQPHLEIRLGAVLLPADDFTITHAMLTVDNTPLVSPMSFGGFSIRVYSSIAWSHFETLETLLHIQHSMYLAGVHKRATGSDCHFISPSVGLAPYDG